MLHLKNWQDWDVNNDENNSPKDNNEADQNTTDDSGDKQDFTEWDTFDGNTTNN